MRWRVGLLAIGAILLAGCHSGKHSDVFAQGWTRELPTSAPRNYQDPGLAYAASGPRGSVALGTGMRFCDLHGFVAAAGGAWRTVSAPPATGRKVTGCAYLSGITATASEFVAVGTRVSGSDKNGGVIWASADGDTWRTVDTGATFTRRRVGSVASDGHLVVASSTALQLYGVPTAEVWYSTDDARWTRVALDTKAEVNAVAHGPHGWIAVGAGRTDDQQEQDGALVWTSKDGVHWTHARSVEASELTTVAAGPAGFIAYGTGVEPGRGHRAEFFTSADGRAWSASTAPGDDVPPSPVVVGRHFVATGITGYHDEGESHPQAAIWVLDGHSWVRAPLPKSMFSEPVDASQAPGAFAKPALGTAVVSPDGSLLLVGGGQPVKKLQDPTYGPRLWRWQSSS